MIRELYEQQKYMYGSKTHSVPNRIVSISQPYIRPIVRGKAKTPTEFGAKLDITTRSSICLSIIAMNVGRLSAVSLCDFLKSIFQSTLGEYLSMLTSLNWQLAVMAT